MDFELIEKVKTYFEHKHIPMIGVASAESLNATAPVGFRPMDVMPNAKSVIIFAKPSPLMNYTTPSNHEVYSFYTASYHTYYRMSNEVANSICYMLQEKGHAALAIPSFNPMKFEGGHFNGLISLKHAAVEAGLGKIGKNTLLINPERGNNLRLGGLVTSMEWPIDGPSSMPGPCPEGCDICYKVCPVGALSDKGIDHLKCMAHCIEHTLIPPHWVMKVMKTVCTKRFLEVYANSFFNNYAVNCCECLKKCPHFPSLDPVSPKE